MAVAKLVIIVAVLTTLASAPLPKQLALPAELLLWLALAMGAMPLLAGRSGVAALRGALTIALFPLIFWPLIAAVRLVAMSVPDISTRVLEDGIVPAIRYGFVVLLSFYLMSFLTLDDLVDSTLLRGRVRLFLIAVRAFVVRYYRLLDRALLVLFTCGLPRIRHLFVSVVSMGRPFPTHRRFEMSRAERLVATSHALTALCLYFLHRIIVVEIPEVSVEAERYAGLKKEGA